MRRVNFFLLRDGDAQVLSGGYFMRGDIIMLIASVGDRGGASPGGVAFFGSMRPEYIGDVISWRSWGWSFQ